MRSFVAKKQCSVPISSFFQHDHTWLLINNSVRIYKENGDILAVFLKNHLKDKKLIDIGRKLYRFKGWSNNRVMAAGKKKGGSGLGNANKVKSSVVGYLEKTHMWPCRQTVLYKKHKKSFDNETSELLNFINGEYYKYAKELYKKQYVFSQLVKPMTLNGTVFTTITVNCDFRTRSHVDKGDFKNGLGNLMVFDYTKSPKQPWCGGEFLLPEFKLAFDIQEGDLLFVDVHEVHCNSAIYGHGRLSLVCYARENIFEKCLKN